MGLEKKFELKFLCRMGRKIKDILENISYRLYSENALSDVTWAMCHTCLSFRDAFLHFFFPEMQISEEIEILREVSKDDSRPDFIIHNNNVLYIIENKINDQNHHFGQYEKSFGVTPERFGYIANYIIPQPDPEQKYPIRTWEDFYRHLGLVNVEDKEEQSLIEGYRAYLRSVCSIINFTKPMNIEGIYSLYQLIEILNKLCKRDEDKYSISVYNQGRTYDNKYTDHSVAGINFEINLKKSKIQAWGWVGIYFSEEIPTICIGFSKKENWGQSICTLLAKAKDLTDGKYSSAPYEEGDAYWFDYIDGKETYEEWFDKLTLEEQTAQLKGFMDEVFNLISELSTAQ